MVEVNEEIARAYFEEVCGYMVRIGFYFKKLRKRRAGKERGGAGPADIDLLIMHPNPNYKQYRNFIRDYGERAMVSVKGWHMEPKSRRSSRTALKTIDDACKSLFEDDQASDVAETFFGTKDFGKLLVVSRLDDKYGDEQRRHAENMYGVHKIIEFKELLQKLLHSIEKRTYFPESPILQTIYTLNKYVLSDG